MRIGTSAPRPGRSFLIVAEKLEDPGREIRASKEFGLEPHIGIRVRLYSKGAGKWAPSGGENAKFGLYTTSLVASSGTLKAASFSISLSAARRVGSRPNFAFLAPSGAPLTEW